MTLDEMIDLFNRDEDHDEFLEFGRITNPRHPRPDLCAFLMLHDLAPCASDENSAKNGYGLMDMVAASEHDEIWLGVDVEALAAAVTPDIVRDLKRCGVRYDCENDSLAMFV
jgi:hypothetical protein